MSYERPGAVLVSENDFDALAEIGISAVAKVLDGARPVSGMALHVLIVKGWSNLRDPAVSRSHQSLSR